MNVSDLSIHQSIKAYLENNGITQLTAIQEQAIPALLERRGDAHGKAQTGTGKTLAFLIPILERLLSKKQGVRGLVVSPTRELALQIHEVAEPLAKSLGLSVLCVYGGVSIEDQIKKLRRGVDLVIGTPGRIRDHLSRGTLKLSNLETLVLDEADIMLDMGFREEVEEILEHTPANREIWLFSATVKEGIDYIKQNYMSNPQVFSVKQHAATTELTQQYVCIVPQKARVKAISRFIEVADDFYGLIFCQTKLLTQEVAEKLNRYGYRVGALHGDMTQNQRNVVIRNFKNRKIRVLVATDVAARGIDIQDLTHVINYSFPEDHESYIHRVGRTGRAGKQGTAITFIEKRDISLIRRIQTKFKVDIEPIEVPQTEDLVQQRIATVRDKMQRVESRKKECKPLRDLVAEYSDEQVRDLLYATLYDQYIAPLAQEDIPSMSADEVVSELKTCELSLSVGTQDGVDRNTIKRHILREANLATHQLKKVRVIQRKTFIEVAADVANSVQKALRGTSIAGMPVRVRIVD